MNTHLKYVYRFIYKNARNHRTRTKSSSQLYMQLKLSLHSKIHMFASPNAFPVSHSGTNILEFTTNVQQTSNEITHENTQNR